MKHSLSSRIFDVSNYIFLTLFTFTCVFPFYHLLVHSLSDPRKVVGKIILYPQGFTLQNYIQIFQFNDIPHAIMISALRAVVGTVVTVFCCALFSYLLTKKELYFRKTTYRLLIVSMYLNAGLIPWYLTMKELGLKNNFLLYVLPYAISAFFIILIKTYIEQLPAALEESAMIDGAGYFTIFSKIIFPLSMPIIATIAIYSAVNQWNTWVDNYFLVTSPNLQTLQLVLYNYLNNAAMFINQSMDSITEEQIKHLLTPQSIQVTITMIVTLPIILVYPFMQKYFVKGIMLGAIKG